MVVKVDGKAKAPKAAVRKAPGTKANTKAQAKAAGDEPVLPPVEGSEAFYEEFLPAAEKLDAAEVVPFRADATLAHYNVTQGRDSLLAEKKRILADIPGFDFASVERITDLALAVIFAVAQANQQAPGGPNADLQSLLAEGNPLRDVMLSAAEVLAKKKLLPAAEVKKIREGSGKLDTARDLVALAALFRRFAAALRGKSPITAEDIQKAASIGSNLIQILKPRRSRKQSAGKTDAADARDRLWTLLVQRHDLMERGAVWRFGMAAAGEHVPPLGSRVKLSASEAAAKKAQREKKAAARAARKAQKAKPAKPQNQ